MMVEIKPIQTKYNGYNFRSRLEARWAVFFDALKIPYQYELDGFENNGEKYLPDFYLPTSETWVEVKGDPLALFKDRNKFRRLHDFGGCLPGFSDSFLLSRYGDISETPGLLLLGDIPNGNSGGVYFHPIIQHHKGLHKLWTMFLPNSPYLEMMSYSHFWTFFKDVSKTVEYLDTSHMEQDWKIETEFIPTPRAYQDILGAYSKARSARFEHGESP
jgi:hypothetical protein